MSVTRGSWVIAMIVLLVGTTAHALTFDTTFDSSVTSRSDSAQWISAWNYAIGQFEAEYSDPITINITFEAGAGGLGASSTNWQSIGGANDYATMKADLLASSKTANDATAYANLPAVDPTGGHSFVVGYAEAKALGLRAANDPATDGVVALNSTVTYTFDPAKRSVKGEYDFIGVAEHEISEVMGRVGILGGTVNGVSSNDPLDLFGYSSAGNLNLNPGQAGVYFSINGGATSLRVYNDSATGGDTKDWAVPQQPRYDSFNVSGAAGHEEDMSAVDMQTMDVIGYDLVTQTHTKGNMKNSGNVNNFDIAPFEMALASPSAYLSAYPSMSEGDLIYCGDINSDGAFDNFDIAPFEALLATGQLPTAPVPEPGTLALLGMGAMGLLAVARRRSSRRSSSRAGLSTGD